AACLRLPTAARAGKSPNSIGILNSSQQSRFKRQRLSGSDATRAQFATQQHMFTSRQERSMERGWSRKETKLRKAFDKRGGYLRGRIKDLTENIRTNTQHVQRLETALGENKLASLLIPVPPSPVEDGEDAGAGLEGKVSEKQINRLWQQGYCTLKVLVAELARDTKQLGLTVEANEVLPGSKDVTDAAVREAEAKRFELLNEASLVRHDASLLRIAANVVETGSHPYAASTILRWLRDFRKQGGFRRDSRGVHEPDWIMSEEDLKVQLVTWMRTQPRLTVKDVWKLINGSLFEDDAKDLARLLSYQVTLPISMSTAHSWMIKLGCKYERATKSFYTDTHEKKDVVEYRGEYIEMRGKLALRQALWVQVQRASLKQEELKRLDRIKAEGPEGDFHSEIHVEKVLQALPDFKNKRTALQHLVESRGHILLLSPKCHPEVAGVGIEYSWGFSKQKFRRKINDEVPKHLHANIEKSLCTDKYLTVGRVRRFTRQTRDYCRAYRDISLRGVVIESKDFIEKMRKNQKAHRNILDMETSFLGNQ
ncbi:unnamed protein product, partial [Ectocarpus sp. 12 AP-2014]